MSTTLLLHNLHCPSCISHVTTLLSSAPLCLDPSHITVSLLTGLVSYLPRPETAVKEVETILQEAGFQVEPTPSTSTSSFARVRAAKAMATTTTSMTNSWFTSRKKRQQDELEYEKEQRRREEAHKQSCRACRGEITTWSPHLGSDPKGKAKDECLVAMPPPIPGLTKTTFVVGGMTCVTCVNGVNGALSNEPSIKKKEVTLIPGRAVVWHDPSLRVEQVKEMIEEAGFDVDVVESVQVGDPNASASESETSEKHGWVETKFVIEGMTCASCVQALDGLFEPNSTPGLRSASVTLLPALATVVHDPRLLTPDQLVDMIEDRGYGAEILSSTPVVGDKITKGNQEQLEPRTVKLRIEGMFCDKCSSAINAHLSSLQASGTIINFDACSMNSPILGVTYIPRPPYGFTLRTLHSSITSLGPFSLHPLHASSTLTLLARQAQSRERRSILLRLLITFIFAIPAFIIGIVLTSLLPSDHPVRTYFEVPLWGSASRAIISLFILATPIQFGIGFFFYERAWKGLRGVWKRGGWREKLWRWGSMDTLVALGTTGGYAASVAFLAIEARHEPDKMGRGSMEMGYFDSSIFLMMFILLGRYLEGLSRQRTGDAIDALAKMKATTGLLYTGPSSSTTGIEDDDDELDRISANSDEEHPKASSASTTQEVDVDYFEVGDVLLIRAGSSVPLDAVLLPTASSSTFDESSLTGESLPIVKRPSDEVYAGTTNLGPSAVLVRATSNAGSTLLDGIVQVVRDAMGKKAAVERLADTVTGVFVPCIVAIALLTFLIWIIRGYAGGLPRDWLDAEEQRSGGWSLFAVQFSVAVLVVACPCGIGLAAPTAQMVGTGLAARLGIVPFGGGEAFQNATRIEAVCFDKTGTLTKGEFTVVRHQSFGSEWMNESTTMKLVEIVEEASSHPISLGVRDFCRAKGTEGRGPVSLVDSTEIAGRGLKSIVQVGSTTFEVLIGNPTLLSEHSLSLDESTSSLTNSWANEGCSIVLVAVRPQHTPSSSFTLVASFGVLDQPRPEASFVISQLEKQGIAVFLCTGDNERTAKAVARSVGIAEECVFAQVLPIDKGKVVERLQLGAARERSEQLKSKLGKGWWTRGRTNTKLAAKVAFVGDGINDVVALSQADVGISMGTGASVALSSSEFCLLSSNLSALLTLFALAKATLNKILTNFVWACLFNGILIPIAAGAFYDLGRTRLPPVWASLAMALSSVSVVVNSLMLRYTFRVPKAVREFGMGT